MKKITHVTYVFILIFQTFGSFSQDFGFTQYQYTPFITNIASIANGSEMRVTFNYRYQEGAFSRPFSTPMLSLSYPLINKNNKRWGAVGGSIINDRTTSFSNTFGAIGGFAYNINLTDLHKISIGTQIGYFSRNVDVASLKTSSQFDGTTTDNGEMGSFASSINMFNIGSAVMYYQEDAYHSPTNFIGISLLNINQPNNGFMKNRNSPLPIAIIATAGYKVWGNDKIAIIPNMKIDSRASLTRANVGASMRYFLANQSSFLKNGYIGFSLWYNSNQAISAMAELNQPNYIVALSYDFVTATSRQTWLSNGAPEITLVYKKAISRKCKDADADGVCDKEDECVDVPGLVALKGCPDKDGDGIVDYKDECPDSVGLARFNGCPDIDNDTIPNHKDECPTQAGLAIFKGCPDVDNDAIPDHKDECPTKAGLVRFNGCPDVDNDTIPDHKDACPETAGLVRFNGCPDTDGDNIIDKNDNCPTVPGIALLKGCPEIVLLPEVQDLLPKDSQDKVPFVQFERKSYAINSEFKAILNKIAAYSKKYPKATFIIEGHTDNMGSHEDNIKLSHNRVNTVYNYLVRNGLNKSKITTDKHGELRPLSDNSSEEGRSKNRRVEIKIVD